MTATKLNKKNSMFVNNLLAPARGFHKQTIFQIEEKQSKFRPIPMQNFKDRYQNIHTHSTINKAKTKEKQNFFLIVKRVKAPLEQEKIPGIFPQGKTKLCYEFVKTILLEFHILIYKNTYSL